MLTISGGVEVARTEERLEELKRRVSSATSWGEPGTELLTPEGVVERVPFVNPDVILGGWYTPGVSVVDPLRAGTLMREYAQEQGRPLDRERGGDRARRRERPHPPRAHDRRRHRRGGRLHRCGVWSPCVARMAGVDPCSRPRCTSSSPSGRSALRADGRRDRLPDRARRRHEHVRAPERSDMEVGSYAHRPILCGTPTRSRRSRTRRSRRPSCRSRRRTSTRSWSRRSS